MPLRPAQIAFAGLGRMGLPMCARLVAGGFRVVATDRRPELRTAVTQLGGRWAPTAADACSEAELAITMLPGPGEVADVADEITASLPSGGCWIDMSTASPTVGRLVAEAADHRGVTALEAPVGGGPEAARDGTLTAFVGGTADALNRCRPVLDTLAERILHIGPAGSGYTVKLLVNTLWFGQAVATAEALALAQRAGLDLDIVRDALLQSAAASQFIATDATALLAGDDLPSFSLARCCEELSSVLALGDELGVPLELAAVVGRLHQHALEHYGDVDGELLGARLVTERAGVTLNRGHAR